VGRALGSAALTALLFRLLPPLSFYVSLPVCVVAFSLCSVALGLVRRADVQVFRALLRRGGRAPEPLGSVLEGSGGKSPLA
jgi:hypothetical protein